MTRLPAGVLPKLFQAALETTSTAIRNRPSASRDELYAIATVETRKLLAKRESRYSAVLTIIGLAVLSAVISWIVQQILDHFFTERR